MNDQFYPYDDVAPAAETGPKAMIVLTGTKEEIIADFLAAPLLVQIIVLNALLDRVAGR